MRTTRSVLVMVAMGFLWTFRGLAQPYINVIPTVTNADIVNATALVDPLTEQGFNVDNNCGKRVL